jgi:SAM-dependent methyltransferase
MSSRIKDSKVDIKTNELDEFFSKRASKYYSDGEVISMLYQDKQPLLANERHNHETKKIIEFMRLDESKVVLDIGCGVGRWAAELRGKIGRYVGVEKSDALLNIAKERFSGVTSYSFENLSAGDCNVEKFGASFKFDIILIAGVLHYLNDDECIQTLKNINELISQHGVVVIRVPVGLNLRLTLNSIWSEELESEYSAIYRTEDEYRAFFMAYLYKSPITENAFSTEYDAPLFESQYDNRSETRQHLFVLRKC